jgi:hypothetical protein
MKTVAVKYALITFAITVAWTLAEHFLGYNTTNHAVGEYTRRLTAFIYYALIVYAIWKQKKLQNNRLSFAQGMGTGARMALIYSVLVALWFAFYAEVINPAYRKTLIAFEREKLVAANASAEQIAAKMKEVEMTSGGSATSYLLLALFMFLGAIFPTLIASAILQRKDRKSV